MAMLALRFDLRAPAWGPMTAAEQYAACLDICEWGETCGFDTVILSEHHGVDDGFLPAPLVMAGAIAGRTRTIGINIAAVLLPLHDPVRLAEQLVVADLASGGRVSFVAGTGYRREEFEMAGVDDGHRLALLEEYVGVIRQACTGEPFAWRGRTIRVTPRSLTQPHPVIMVGGSTVKAAQRAARLRVGFFPADDNPEIAEAYAAECAAVGFAEGFCSLPARLGFIHIAHDPERAWEQIMPHAMHEAKSYGAWQRPGQRSAVSVYDTSTEESLRASGVYRVLTPDEAVALHDELGDHGVFMLHPLMGGLPPELAWESLRLFESDVLARIRPAESEE